MWLVVFALGVWDVGAFALSQENIRLVHPPIQELEILPKGTGGGLTCLVCNGSHDCRFEAQCPAPSAGAPSAGVSWREALGEESPCPQTPMKASGRRYEPGERKGRKHVSTKWPKGVRKGKRFTVTHKRPLLFEVGAKLLVQATSKNSFEILRVVHNKVARRP